MKEYTANTHGAESLVPSRAAAGFRAHLQGVSLHDLVMLQHLTRASGVYVVLSGERSGVLHFSGGTLFHAETAELTGNLAAVEILSWPDGEFITSTQATMDRASVSLSIEDLLGSRAGSIPSEPPLTSSTGIRKRLTLRLPEEARAPSQRPPARDAASGGATARTLAAVATPGMSLATPRAMTRGGETSNSTVQVFVSPRGELISGQGPGLENAAARVAYVSRLAELIGQAMGSGEALGLKVRSAASELCIRRHADGHISGSIGAVDAVDAAPTPIPPPLPGAPLSVPPPTRRSRLT